MTDQQHSITPPFELMNQWYKKACKDPYNGGKFIMSQVLKDICNSAAQWGADQELEACYTEVTFWGSKGMADRLQATRRPKPSSEVDLALETLNWMESEASYDKPMIEIIRRQLERLKELEALPND